MTKGKKDHFVQQSYLRHFATSNDKKAQEDWKIYSHDRANDATLVRINSVAYGKHFERHSNEAITEQIKQTVWRIENVYSKVHKKLVLEESLTSLSEEEFYNFAFGVAFQRERTLARRNLYKARLNGVVTSYQSDEKRFSGIYEGIVQQQLGKVVPSIQGRIEQVLATGSSDDIANLFSELGVRLPVPKPLLGLATIRRAILEHVHRAIREIYASAEAGDLQADMAREIEAILSQRQNVGNLHLEKMFEFAKLLGQDLMHCVWVLWVNQTAQPLWTSDNPAVTFLNPSKEKLPEPIRGLIGNVKVFADIFESTQVRDSDGKIHDDFCLLFPVSPRLLLQVHQPDEERGLRFGNAKIRSEEDTYTFNFYQLINTSRNLYCNEDKFEVLKDMKLQARGIIDAAMNELKLLPDNLDELIERQRKNELAT